MGVTVTPRFSSLGAPNQHVALSRVVLAGMLILGGVAAADVATVQTHPEVNPRVSRGEALLTPIYRGWEVGDLVR